MFEAPGLVEAVDGGGGEEGEEGESSSERRRWGYGGHSNFRF